MKILFAGSYNKGNTFTGPEKVARRIFNLASKDPGNFNTVFASYFFDGNKYGLLKKIFGKGTVITNSSEKVYRFGILRVFFYTFKFRPDVIHIITYERYAVVFFLYRLFRKVKIIYNVHGIAVYENSINQNASEKLRSRDSFCEKIYFKHSDILIFLSELSKKNAHKFYEFDDSKVVIIPNGIDKEFYDAGIKRKAISGSVLKAVFIGDINKIEKGFNELISALKKIEFNIDLFAVSNIPPDKITSEVISNNDKLNFHLINKMDTENFAEFLSDKDIFISASSYEQFSLAAVESMAAGLVAIVSAETGMASYIQSGFNGFVFNNEDELISILNTLNADRNSISNISAKSKMIYHELNIDNVFMEYKKLYS